MRRNPEAIADAIREARTIAVCSHVNPDGDTLGSATAIRLALLETGKEDSITVSRNGKPVVRMVFIHETPVSNRIGIAEGKFRAPDDFDANNAEIYDMLAGGDL